MITVNITPNTMGRLITFVFRERKRLDPSDYEFLSQTVNNEDSNKGILKLENDSQIDFLIQGLKESLESEWVFDSTKKVIENDIKNIIAGKGSPNEVS